jgi:hypothetical protein
MPLDSGKPVDADGMVNSRFDNVDPGGAIIRRAPAALRARLRVLTTMWKEAECAE